jgi:hypothetical protein
MTLTAQVTGSIAARIDESRGLTSAVSEYPLSCFFEGGAFA